MRHPTKVWIDFSFYEPNNGGCIAASFKKISDDDKKFILASKAKKEIYELKERILNLEMQIDCLNRWNGKK